MISKIKALVFRFRHEILYVIFGGGTTLVNIAAYFVATRLLGMGTVAANVVAWVLAVLFAYVSNRRAVFESSASGAKEIFKEMFAFFVGRAATGAVDLIVMYVGVDVLGANDAIMKLASNVIVVILNYVIGKLIVFGKR